MLCWRRVRSDALGSRHRQPRGLEQKTESCDNREFVIGGGTQPSTEPIRAGGLDGSAAAEERDNYHRDAYMNDRNHASGAPRPGRE